MNGEQKLYMKLDELRNAIPENQRKYYHFLSIENFIFHLKNIKNERSKLRIADQIDEYIELVFQKLNDPSEIRIKSKELFPSVWKLSDFYKYELGFIRKPDYLIITILIAVLFFLLRISFNKIQSLILSITVFAGYAVYGYIKLKARKVW